MLLFGIGNLQGQKTLLRKVCFFLGRALFATLRLITITQFKLEPTKALLHTSQVDNPDHLFLSQFHTSRSKLQISVSKLTVITPNSLPRRWRSPTLLITIRLGCVWKIEFRVSLVIIGSSNFQHRMEFQHQGFTSSEEKSFKRKRRAPKTLISCFQKIFTLWRNSSESAVPWRCPGNLIHVDGSSSQRTRKKQRILAENSLSCLRDSAEQRGGLENTDRGEWQESHVHTSNLQEHLMPTWRLKAILQ